MQCKSLKEEKFETLIHDLQTSILMVKKVAPQNNDLLKYNDKNCIIMLNVDIKSLHYCSCLDIHINIVIYFFEK